MGCWLILPFCPFSLCARWQTWTRISWWPRVQSTEEGGRGVEEHVWGREWVGWFDLVVGEAPCTQGFLLLGGRVPRQQRDRREVSIHTARWPAELRQQNQQSVSKGQLQKVHSKNQGSFRSQREPVTGYSPEIFLNRFLEEPEYMFKMCMWFFCSCALRVLIQHNCIII